MKNKNIQTTEAAIQGEAKASLWKRLFLRLRSFLKFLLSSGLSFLVDTGVFYALYSIFTTQKLPGALAWSLCIARIISIFFNFFCNRHLVFTSQEQRAKMHKSLPKYLTLAAVQITAVYLLLKGLETALGIKGLSVLIAKIIIETILFLISYKIQKYFIFRVRTTPTQGK